STTGDRGNDFSVTFEPIEAGRRLRVVRRITDTNLGAPVTVVSVYDKTSDVAQLDIYNGSPSYQPNRDYPNNYPNNTGTVATNGDFIVPDGTEVVAVLNNNLTTRDTRDNDRFTMTVRSPYQYEGATINGYVSNVQRSGRITGRSQMTLNFDSITLRNGQTYRFAGIAESVRAMNGETVRVDNEGAVRDRSQTTQTEQRAAIGTAVGAIIGAIAGGGKGAAIGAILGAGAGAGSVYVQGQNDLELVNGTEVTVRASGPR
ncbi:MAG: YMGG-like glycine zipper-containing protein, partial [Acidobacteriota bacterium]|nr:YMGG-like glycine zipper-containing protein [Acidobacteriota bacterium]